MALPNYMLAAIILNFFFQEKPTTDLDKSSYLNATASIENNAEKGKKDECAKIVRTINYLSLII